MATPRGSIVLHNRAEEEPINGWPKAHVELFQEYFDVVFLTDVLVDKSLGERVIACAYRPHSPVHMPSIEDHLDLFPNLKVISNFGVGMDHFTALYPEISKRGIVLTNLKTPGVLFEATADMALCLMLATSRNLRTDMDEAMGPSPISAFKGNTLGRDVSFSTLGIFGMGNIGYKVAQRAKAFDMKILYHNRSRRSVEDEAAVGATFCEDLHEMLKDVDFLVICSPMTSSTRHRFGENEFNCMKPSSVVINVARGPIIITDDLVKALETKKIRAAGLDVTDPEPLPRDHPLLKMTNVIITPHGGSKTEQTRARMVRLTAENAVAVIEGRPTENAWTPS